jgi:UPF0271 protein
MTQIGIDINCDMGESFGAYTMGHDAECLRHISSANIACGFHAGDWSTMRDTVETAAAAGVSIGAHPGLPDLQGFGRRAMAMSPREIHDIVIYQVGAMLGFCKARGVPLAHVKPHGALWHMASSDIHIADAVCQATAAIDRGLLFYSPFGSLMTDAAQRAGLKVVNEVFADRSYQDSGLLTPRGQPGAMIESVDAAMNQVLTMVREGYVTALSGVKVPVRADSICVHGDQPQAVSFAAALRLMLEEHGVRIAAPARALKEN